MFLYLSIFGFVITCVLIFDDEENYDEKNHDK